MKTKLFFAVCLIMMAAAFVSCGKNASENNEKPIIASVASQRDIESDSLMLISELWGRMAEDNNIDFSQDTAHILIEKKIYRIDACFPELTPISAFFENNKGGNVINFVHGAQKRTSPLPGCSLIYQGKHNEFDHYVLVVDQKKYTESLADAKTERKITEVHYSDGTIEKF